MNDNFSDCDQNISIQPQYQKYLKGDILGLFEIIRSEIIALDISVKEEFFKYYIAYKTFTNFVDIYPQKNRLRIILNMNSKEIDEPKNICKDIIGWRMNGDIEVSFSSLSQVEDIMFLVHQAFQKHSPR